MTNMTTNTNQAQTPMPTGMNPAHNVPARSTRRLSTETKSAFKTTEFLAYLGTVVAVLIAAQTIGRDSGATNGGDYFRADKAFLYITFLTVGYLLSRGLAKSGSRDFYDDSNH